MSDLPDFARERAEARDYAERNLLDDEPDASARSARTIRCTLCGLPVADPGYIATKPYHRHRCHEKAMHAKGLTMRAPREDTLPGLEETR
jgi:hypothetical protein